MVLRLEFPSMAKEMPPTRLKPAITALALALLMQSQALPTLQLGFCGYNEDVTNPPPFPGVIAIAKEAFESSNPIVPMPGTSKFNVDWHLAYTDNSQGSIKEGMKRMMGTRLDDVTHPPAQALVGCGGSSTSAKVAPFGAFLGVPLVSWWAGSPTLSNKLEFPYFMRTRGTSTGNGAGVIQLCSHFGWKKVGFIHQEQSFHIGVYTGAINRGLALGIEISPFRLFNYPDTVDESVWKVTFQKCVKSGIRVFGLSVIGVHGVVARKVGLEVGLNTRLVIMALELADFFPSDPQNLKDAWNGMLGIDAGQSGQNAQADRFEAAWKNMTFAKMRQLGIIEEWVVAMETTVPQVFSSVSPFMQFQVYLFDAIFSMMIAYQKLLDQGMPGNKTSYGQDYLDALYSTKFDGASGFVSFTPIKNGQGGDRETSTFNLFSVKSSQVRNIGSVSTNVTLTEDPIFPDSTNNSRNYDIALVCQGNSVTKTLGGNQTCVTCTAGNGPNKAKDSCVPCGVGQYSPIDGALCYPCQRGAYQPAAGKDSCTTCATGTFTDTQGQSACKQCDAGTMASGVGSTACTNCTMGSAQPARGKATCIRCEIGSYTGQKRQTACVTCDGGRVTPGIGAISADECLCAQDSYSANPQSNCLPCPDGMSCALGSDLLNFPWTSNGSFRLAASLQTFPHLLPEYFSSKSQPMWVYKCRNDDLCPGGPPGSCSDKPADTGFECPKCPAMTYLSNNNRCEDCQWYDSLSLTVTMIVFFVGSLGILYLSSRKLTATRPQLYTIMATGGQLCTFVQICAALGATGLDWGNPLNHVLGTFTKIFSFDFEIVKVECWSVGSPLAGYIFQVLTPVCSVAVVVIAFFCAKKMGRAVSYDGLINAVGQILVILYISLTLLSFTPFQCYKHPNGMKSVNMHPKVFCFEDDDQHSGMIAFAILAIIIYPGLLLSAIIWAVIQYPKAMCRDNIGFVWRFRFMFFRWSPERYWFIAVMIIRNFFLAFWPMVIPEESVDVTIVLMHLTLLVVLLMTVKYQPWRTSDMNTLDMLLSLGLLIMVNVGTLSVYGNEISMTVSALLTAICVGSMLVCIIIVLWRFKEFRQANMQWAAFLSHHKGGGACAARLLKYMLSKMVRGPIFYDCDNLLSFGGIFDAVKQSYNLIVVLSGETLCRPWCVGEIVLAHRSNIPMHSVTFVSSTRTGLLDKWQSMTDDELKNVYGTFEVLRPHSISLEDITPAFQHLLAQKAINIDLANSSAMNLSVTEIAKKIGTQPTMTTFTSRLRGQNSDLLSSGLRNFTTTGSTLTDYSSKGSTLTDGNESTAPADFPVLIMTDHEDTEATASGHVLRKMLRVMLQDRISMDIAISSPDLAALFQTKSLRVILLLITPSTLKSSQQISRMALLFKIRPSQAVHPIVIGESFDFPSSEFYSKLESGATGLESERLSKHAGAVITLAETANAVKKVFAGIALFVNIAYANEELLLVSVKKIFDRASQGLRTEPTFSMAALVAPKFDPTLEDVVEGVVMDVAEGCDLTPEDVVVEYYSENEI